MEAIKTYMDNVFLAFGDNNRAVTLKRDMLASMEEKYNALKADGKSEHEAVGGIIADFGNINEIAAELGIKTVKSDAQDTSQEELVPVSREEAYDLINQFKKSGRWIGLGVWIIIIGVALFLQIADLSFKNSEGVSLLTLLTFVAGAVPLFIIHGMALSRFEILEESGIMLDTSTRAEIELARKGYTPKFATYISLGVVIIILAVGLFLMLGSNETLQISAASIMLFLIGGAIMMFVTTSMTFGAYEILLEEGEYSRREKAIARADNSERIIGTVAAVFWPTIVAAYLLWSFIGDAWHISWLIWPVAGVLFGAFAGGIATWNEGRQK